MSSSPDGRASTKSSVHVHVRQYRRAPGEGALLEALVPDYLKVLKYAPREYAQGPVHVLLDVRVSCLIGIKSSKYPYGMVVRFGRPRVSRRKKTPGGAGTHTGHTGHADAFTGSCQRAEASSHASS